MKHRLQRRLLGRRPTRRFYRNAALSALFIGAVTAGVGLTEGHQLLTRNDLPSLTVAEMSRATNDEASRNAIREQTKPAPATPPPAPVVAQSPVAPPPPPPPPPHEKVLNIQYQVQPNFYYCGPAATRIALTALGRFPSQDELAAKLGTTMNGTNSAEDTTRVLNSLGGTNSYRTRTIPGWEATPAEMDRLQADVVNAITKGRAIVANINGSAVDTNGTYHGYPGGHYIAIVGYQDDGRIVKIADPANSYLSDGYWVTTINMANWMAEKGYSA